MKTALLALTMVGALAGTTLNTVAQDPNDDQVIQELRDERSTLAAMLTDLEADLELTMQQRLEGQDQLHSLESKLTDVQSARETVLMELQALREELDRSMVERDMVARHANETQREADAQIAAMERDINQREMLMERERGEMELNRARQELDMERVVLERRLAELERTTVQDPRPASITAPAAAATGSSGITIIMNGGDLHIHGSTDRVNVQPAGSR